MSVTVKEVTWDELLDQIRAQSERIHETDSDERRLIDPAMILMDIREMCGCEPAGLESQEKYDFLEDHGLIERLNCGWYVCTDKGAALADQLIGKETAYERDQRRDHMDDHL